MTKELQDLTWSVLPKEFKEEVKRDYLCLTSAYKAMLDKDTLTNPECDRCKVIREKISIYSMYFGHHNLTSDAEGEEILTCEKSKVQNYKRTIDEFLPKAFSNYDKGFWTGQKAAVDELFGSKCLPDEEQIAENANCKEPKPAELFKIGSKVIYKRTNKVKIIKDITNKGMYIITTLNGQSPLCINSFDIELLE